MLPHHDVRNNQRIRSLIGQLSVYSRDGYPHITLDQPWEKLMETTLMLKHELLQLIKNKDNEIFLD